MSNQIGNSDESLLSEVRWCPNKTQLQDTWVSAVEAALESVAEYDPRVSHLSSGVKKKVFKTECKHWHEVNSAEHVEEPVPSPPEGLPAFEAVGWAKGRQGVDMRPHLYDASRKSFLLLDSGSQVCNIPT